MVRQNLTTSNMKSIEFTEKELEVIILGLRERENRMFLDAEIYKNQGNKEAQMDCLDEMRFAENTRRWLQEIKKQ